MGMRNESMKGQVSIEQITAYAWIVGIVVVTIIVFWQLGGEIPFLSKKKAVEPGMFEVVDWIVYSNGSLRLLMRSRAETTITNVNVSAGAGWDFVSEMKAGKKAEFLIQNATNESDVYEIDLHVDYEMLGENFSADGKLYGVVGR